MLGWASRFSTHLKGRLYTIAYIPFDKDRWGLRTTFINIIMKGNKTKQTPESIPFVYTLQLLWKDWSFCFPTSFTVTAFQTVSMFSAIWFQNLVFISNFCIFNVSGTLLYALPLDICLLARKPIPHLLIFLLETQCPNSEACYHTIEISWFILMSNTDTQKVLSL